MEGLSGGRLVKLMNRTIKGSLCTVMGKMIDTPEIGNYNSFLQEMKLQWFQKIHHDCKILRIFVGVYIVIYIWKKDNLDMLLYRTYLLT